MKYFLATFLLFLTGSLFAQQMSYKEWQELAKDDIRLLPEYGHVKKDAGQIEADQKLIKDETVAYGTRRKASDTLVIMGFSNIYKNDLKHAMYRFNQAWLLDPNNENVYWGFGAIYLTLNNYTVALSQYDKGLILNSKSSNIITDKATLYMSLYQTGGWKKANLNKAIALFIQSYNIDPKNQNTLFKLSVAYYNNNDCINALKYYNACMKFGGRSITPGYGEALKKRCNN